LGKNDAKLSAVFAELRSVLHTSGTVFLRAGQPVKPEAAKAAMRRAWHAAGLDDHPKPWKSLRATFATRATEAGVDPLSLARLMGLTSDHVLRHYVEPSGKHLAASVAKISKVRSESA